MLCAQLVPCAQFMLCAQVMLRAQFMCVLSSCYAPTKLLSSSSWLRLAASLTGLVLTHPNSSVIQSADPAGLLPMSAEQREHPGTRHRCQGLSECELSAEGCGYNDRRHRGKIINAVWESREHVREVTRVDVSTGH